MINICEYLLSKTKKSNIIHATNDTIKQIVKDELDIFGHDADLSHIDVSKVTNMDSLFSCSIDDLGSSYKDLNPDISRWDVSNVTNMNHMFYYCENFNCDISDWNVKKVQDMVSMFYECKRFNQNLSHWNVSNSTDMIFMFYNCPIKEEYKPKF